MTCSLQHEEALRKCGVKIVAGIDEAGRGPLAGPVTAAAVVLPDGFSHESLNDSKKLSASKREAIYEELVNDQQIVWAVAIAHSEEIDRTNILQATHAAMARAALALSRKPEHALIDGLPVRDFPLPHTAIVKGDSLSLSIAAASVIAKVTRDRLMCQWDAKYPMYGFAKHKGYGTALHLEKLRAHGPCEIHRKSFLPCSEQLGLF